MMDRSAAPHFVLYFIFYLLFCHWMKASTCLRKTMTYSSRSDHRVCGIACFWARFFLWHLHVRQFIGPDLQIRSFFKLSSCVALQGAVNPLFTLHQLISRFFYFSVWICNCAPLIVTAPDFVSSKVSKISVQSI